MFFPQKVETLYSPLSKSEVIQSLRVDLNTDKEDLESQQKKWFKGIVEKDQFEISLLLKRPNNFTPIISGIVESEEKGGSMILTKYQLFPSSKRFLVFWTILTLLITLFFAIPYQAYWYAAISLAACMVNYVITRENFNIQTRKSRRALTGLISS